jgi:hypothetical protein
MHNAARRRAQAPPRSYARAVAGYDADFEQELLEAITTAIGEASRVTDASAMVIRTAETASALITALASVLAMSPAALRSPTAIRRTIDELGKRLRRPIAAAERDPEVQAFVRRCFRSTEVEGSA